MNPYWLSFKDSKLEAKFIEYQMPICKESLSHGFLIDLAALIYGIIQRAMNKEYVYIGFYAFLLSIYMLLYYKARYQVGSQKLIVLYYQCYLLLCPYFMYFYIIFANDSQASKCALITYNHIFVQCAIMSQNLLVTSLQFANSLAMLIVCFNQLLGPSQIYYMGILYYFHWLQQEYQKIKTNRTNFISSQINESLYEIMTKTQEYPLNIFTYNQSQNQYDIELTKDNFNLKLFLRTFYLDSETTLGQYIYQKFICQKQEDFAKYELSGFIHNKSSRQQIELFVQSYPKLKFIIRMKENQIRYPREIVQEQQLTDIFIQKAMNTFGYPYPDIKIIRIFQYFKTCLYAGRMTQYYRYKQFIPPLVWIDFNSFFQRIASQYRIDINFIGKFQYRGDAILLNTVLEGIILLIRGNNKLNCTISTNINQVIIYIVIEQPITKLLNIQKTEWFTNLNFLVRQLSFTQFELKSNSLEFSILKDEFFSFL